jgi:hypothetical protein
MLSAYVLIETEVGKVAHVAQAITKLDGVQLAEDLAGPYDVIANVQAPRPRPTRPAGGIAHPGFGRRHAHRDLHGAAPLAARHRSMPR